MTENNLIEINNNLIKIKWKRNNWKNIYKKNQFLTARNLKRQSGGSIKKAKNTMGQTNEKQIRFKENWNYKESDA